MKRFLTSVAFCFALLIIGIVLFSPASNADVNLAEKLLDLPAPPPANPFFKPPRIFRDPDFYDPSKPPSDDAPIEDILDYWMRQNQVDRNRNFASKPSEKTLERIISELSDNPERLSDYLNLFEGSKDGIDFVKSQYDSEMLNRKFGKEWRDSVKNWLTFNSPYFSNELAQIARTVRDEDEYVSSQEELLALSRVDWDKAEPILNRLENNNLQPISQTLARWAYYQHALDNKDSLEAGKWRDLLKKTVEDKSAKPGNRDLAMDALVRGGDFEGRDEWYMSLLNDETLHDLRVNGRSYTGLTTIINYSPEGKYTSRMIDLLASDSKSVRSAAIRNLAASGSIKSEDAVKAMLPWLEDPDWATDVNGSRRLLVSALKEFRVPESVNGLIAMLADRERLKAKIRTSTPVSNSNVVIDVPSTPGNMSIFEYRMLLGEVVGALGKQGDGRAVPELKSVMPEFEAWQRQQVVRAIIDCNGYSAFEQVDGVEFVARNNAKQAELEKIEASQANIVSGPVSVTNTVNMAVNPPRSASDELTPDALRLMIGSALYVNDNPSEDLVLAMMNRIDTLEKKEPVVASNMKAVLRNWTGTAVNSVLMREIKNKRAEIDDILKVISRRAAIRDKQSNDIFDMRGGGSFAVGISACMLEQNGEYDSIIGGEDDEAKTAMLACARLIRAKLPVLNIAPMLNSGNKLLVRAAESYLEAEDSQEARRLVLARHPNEAKVLGARTTFKGKGDFNDSLREVFVSVDESEFAGMGYGMEFDYLDKVEDKIRAELLADQNLLGVYSFNKNFVRIYAGKAVFSWEEDPARFRERTLEDNEFDRLKGFFAESRVDELPPFLAFCGEYCGESRELLMMGRAGGRRVFQMGYELPPFFKKLDTIFEDFRRPPAKLRYYMQKQVPGLEILFEDAAQQAVAVWKSGPDLRVLLDNADRRSQIETELSALDAADEENENLEYEAREERRRKRHDGRAFESLAWFRFGNNRPIAPAEQPADFSFIPARDRLAVQPDQSQWKSRTATLELRTDFTGLYKVVRGALTKMRAGFHENAVIGAGGRWALVKRYGDGEGEYAPQVIRMNLVTGREFKVNYAQFPPLQPIVWVPSQNRFLTGTGYGYNEYEDYEPNEMALPEPEFQNYFWLEPETGAMTPVKGTITPLAQQSWRALQPVTGKPDEFWAALPDAEKNLTVIGTYNAKALVFKPLLTLPLIQFSSVRMWVDETEAKAYVAYSGHLLGFPLKTLAPSPAPTP